MSSNNSQPNQNEGVPEALQALLQAMSPDATQNVTPEALQRLSDRLSALMGEDVVRDAFAHKDRAGELVNEEGLPIVDITESETDSQNTINSNITLTEDPKLVPWSSLPPAERERRRRERDRILDLLEAEEELEQRRADEKERLERQEALEKRKQAARTEIEQLKALKETHKKMGKALLRASKEENGSLPVTENKPGSSKKSVSFAEAPQETASSSAELVEKTDETDWGDVAQGRLRPSTRTASFSQSERLMKMSVVERIPGAGKQRAIEIKNEEGDSDDESDLGVSNSDEGEAHDDSATEYSDNDAQGDSENNLEEEVDFDFAQHQREIALEYHRKRGEIGEAAASALTSHTHAAEEGPSADVSVEKTRPPISQFRANRLVSSYAASAPSSSTSQSLESSVLPKSGAQTLQNAIRMGKLDDDENLIGGDAGESGSEGENENMQDILELLKKGEVYNLGPNGEFVHSIPPPNSSSALAAPPPPFTVPSEPLPPKPKTSKFKLARSQASRAVDTGSPSLGTPTPSTPVSTVGRSSPKLPTRSVVVERVPTSTTSPVPDAAGSNPDHKNSLPSARAKFSPISPPDQLAQTVSGSQATTVIESASFPRPTSASSLMIIDSPSFPSTSRPSYRPERPPVIMSSTVVESGRHASQGSAPSTEAENVNISGPAKKMSRFKAERM